MSSLSSEQARLAADLLEQEDIKVRCPICKDFPHTLAIRRNGNGPAYECDRACPPADIAAALATAMPQAPEQPAADDGGWLDGSPMDPAAETVEPLPALAGFPFMHAGGGALISGPTGAGRSSLFEACSYDAARAGLRVAYLGSEVTEPEFNARAADLAQRRGDAVDDTLRGQLAQVRYLNLASVIAQAWKQPARWVKDVADRFDVVGIDPLSAVASTLNLNFDQSNAEFVSFYDKLIRPATSAGVAFALLDNIGHANEASARAKGVSAKSDLADLTVSCKRQAAPVGLILTMRKVRTVRAPFRHGDQWIFLREAQTVEPRAASADDAPDSFRPTLLMERVSRFVEAHPGVVRRLIKTEVNGRNDYVMNALDLLIAEGYVSVQTSGKAQRHTSVKPYRDATGPPRAHTGPTRGRGPTEEPGPSSPDPYKGDGGARSPQPWTEQSQEQAVIDKIAATFDVGVRS